MKKNAISFSLSLRFMLLIAFAMLSFALIFVLILDVSVARRQDEDLRRSVELISESVLRAGTDELAFLDLAYYVTYTVYEPDSRQVLSTNDSLLPLLDSGGKSRTHFEKDFFTDSDLNIRYLTETVELGGTNVIVECALDIANDSAAKMLSAVPRLVVLALLPILLVSFALSFLISRRTITAFKTLQADYDREKAFTANVSHELKTPIAVIEGHANLLKRWGKDDPEQLSASVDAIIRETETMSGIVTTLLDMSRLERGTVAVEKTRFFATNFFVRLKEEFCALYPAMRFTISDEDFSEIETDEAKLHQIFTVILSNSVKFAGKDCDIMLSARKIGEKTVLSASDNGPGFAPEVISHVFERFFKGDASHNRNAGGAGLGLSIAKTLSEVIGADIRAENATDGGARLTITL